MYMRVTRARSDPAKFDELAGGVGQDVAAAIRRLPGCQSYLAGGDRASGTLIAVSTWDTEEHARFSRGTAPDVVSRLETLGVQLDPPEIFEVTST
jgi:quinol monooxygenase YgiN